VATGENDPDGLVADMLDAMLPLTNLPAAWFVIAVYVLIGFLATVGRLVPARTL
jgi:hypothetical protein